MLTELPDAEASAEVPQQETSQGSVTPRARKKNLGTVESQRIRREAELAEAKKAEAERVRQAKQEELRRKHEEHLAAEEARKVRCSKLKCDMDIIEGKKSVTTRLEDRKAELKKKEEEDLLIAKWERHETCATGKDFYNKLQEHEVTVKTKAEEDARERQGRVAATTPVPTEYKNEIHDQFLKKDAERKAEYQRPEDLNLTQSQGKRSNMIQYAQAVQKEILPNMQKVPMVVEEEKKTVPRESKDMKERNKEGNMAIRSTSPQQQSLAHS